MVIFSYKASIIAEVSERFSEVLPINLVSTYAITARVNVRVVEINERGSLVKLKWFKLKFVTL